ncbi:MAG: MoaD/ThiS family protein [Thermodesulfobacteriota bacterium]|nr:MoaD/ThiS family protein [Thermodesulfobacteriota bacterium]
MPTVIIPFPLRTHGNNQREITIVGSTLKKTMDRLFHDYPGLKAMDDDSGLLFICINSKLIKASIDKWDRLSLNKNDEIVLIIPICGG